MIPNTIAILLYQLVSILGVGAMNQIVIDIAYRRRDLDFKLMYMQGPIDLIMNYKKFDKTTVQKFAIILLVLLAMVLQFIPTIFTKINSPGSIYYNSKSSHLGKAMATSIYNWPNTMPVFDNFVPYLLDPTLLSLQAMTTEYIKKDLHQSSEKNSAGYWFTPSINQSFEWNSRQGCYLEGFFTLDNYGEFAENTAQAFGLRPLDSTYKDSFTLSDCVNKEDRVIKNLPIIYGNKVQAAENEILCYPIYDASLFILLPIQVDDVYQSSLLDANDTLFRPTMLSEGTMATSSFGVSIYNHNASHMTMGIKKTAHITLYSYNKTAILPTDCSMNGRYNFTNNFIDLPYNAVLCDLINTANTFNETISIFQAASRKFIKNFAINTVYTFQKGTPYQMGHSIMIDFSVFQTFNVKGNLLDAKEHMVAFSKKTMKYDKPSDGTTAVNLSNDRIGSLLKELDPSSINQETIDFLVSMASMRVRWENGDYSDFLLNETEVMDAVQTPTWWIVTIAVLALVFLIPQAGRLTAKRIPEYAEDLRTLLLLTIERSHTLDGARKEIKNVSISSSAQNNLNDSVTLLSVNGYPLTVAEKQVNAESSLINEKNFT